MALVYLDDVVVCELVNLFRSRRVGRSIGTLTFFLKQIVYGFSICFVHQGSVLVWAEDPTFFK